MSTDPITADSAFTWDAIEYAARTCPVLNVAVTRVRQGDVTREQALIAVALWLSQERAGFLERETQRLMRQPADPMMWQSIRPTL